LCGAHTGSSWAAGAQAASYEPHCSGVFGAGRDHVYAGRSRGLHFRQTGYSEGGSATGSFTADDLNPDGAINSLPGEGSDFSVSFSGNSIFSAFSLGYSDLLGLYHSPTTFSILTSSDPLFSRNASPGQPCTPL
jgi:hypothetical protein